MSSRGVNKVILIGHVGQDPEERAFPNGDAVVNFSLATSESWKDKNTGQTQERTEWHRLVAFRRLAEIISEYVRKGAKLYIEGSLRTRSWEQDGVTRYATEIVVSEMQMLDRRDGQESDTAPASRSAGRPDATKAAGKPWKKPPPAPVPAPDYDDFDDDIPF